MNKTIARLCEEQFKRHGGNSLIYWEEFPCEEKEFDVRDYVQKLVELGAKPRAKLGKRKISPLHKCNNPDFVAALLEAGANVDARDYRGYTPLHLCKNAEVARLLIDAYADVNATNESGVTPLHLAEDVAVARLLIDEGADPNAIDRWGRTAAAAQREEGYVDVAEYIERFMAPITIDPKFDPYFSHSNPNAKQTSTGNSQKGNAEQKSASNQPSSAPGIGYRFDLDWD